MSPQTTPPRRYGNPILAFDVPDPDVIALEGGGYAMVASSFGRQPGLPLWRSDDLVHWEPAGFAGGWQPLVQPSGGVWAPALRQRDGRLFITWADPDRGVFVVDAADVEGPWSEPRLLLEGPGPIDPCPFWDDDGRTWLVHGWARSRAGFANRLDLVEVDDRLTTVVGAARILIDGDELAGCTVLEGPKLYRREGEYFVFAPAGGVETGWQYVFRSPDLAGPWEPRIVLEQGGTDINGPHQGAWVEGAAGEEWFLHFQHTPQHGRVLHLQPLSWGADGWPRVGAATAGGAPEPLREWKMPTPRPHRATPPARAAISPHWHGRGVDPRELRGDGGQVRLIPGQMLVRPLEASAASTRVILVEGHGSVAVVGAEHRRLTIGEPVEPEAGVTETVIAATPPVTVGIESSGASVRFTVADEPVGDWFQPEPAQWTGIEIGVSARTGSAVFDLGDA